MVKSLGQSLYGLSPEVKKRIRDEIKLAQSAISQEGNKQEDDYWNGLSNLSKTVQDLIDKSKADGSIPKGTTLEKLSKIPKTKPKRWAALYKKLFGRKTRSVKTNAMTETRSRVKKIKARAKKN